MAAILEKEFAADGLPETLKGMFTLRNGFYFNFTFLDRIYRICRMFFPGFPACPPQLEIKNEGGMKAWKLQIGDKEAVI